MQLSIIALASSEWGIARFTTDSFALLALGILATLPIVLLKNKIGGNKEPKGPKKDQYKGL